MKRDVDKIIEQVTQQLPRVQVRQHRVKNPSVDDDGVWWFSLPQVKKDIQIDSWFGMCPFTVKHDDMASSSEAETANKVEEAVKKVVSYLTSLQDGESLKEAIGTIIGVNAGCVVVQLENGEEVLCRGMVRLHRALGFFAIPIGRRARIRLQPNPKNKRPLILEVLDSLRI